MRKKVFITGVAGFIGYHMALSLLKKGDTVIGIDNLNDYYSPTLKHDRLAILKQYDGFSFEILDIADPEAFNIVEEKYFDFNFAIHLAAQAGVRYSLQNPFLYVQSNLVGFFNVLQFCKKNKNLQHLVYASTSSVYGTHTPSPFKEIYVTDQPESFYASTKIANENMAQSYYSLYNMPITALRYFTVYGPFGRPDMAPFKFTNAILNKKTIDVFGFGKLERDFTYIDDIVDGTLQALEHIPNTQSPEKKHPIYNLGYGQSITVEHFIQRIEENLKIPAIKNYIAKQPGDVYETLSDCTKAKEAFHYKPKVSIDHGIKNYINWFKKYYNV